MEMHEASLAVNLVEAACQAAAAAGARQVKALRVRCGVLSGTAPAALRSAFMVAAAGTSLTGARLDIEEGPLIAYCAACQRDVPLPALMEWQCPACGQETHDLRAGRELELVALEIE